MKTLTVAAALFGFVLAGCSGNPDGEGPAAAVEPVGLPPPAERTPAPEVRADYWINTEALSLANLRGQVVVVEFWATWCPPCRVSIPHLIELNDRYADQGVVLVSLTNEPLRTVEPFVEQMGMDYPIGGGSSTGGDYGVEGIPTAFIVDREGRIAWRGHPLDQAMERALVAAVTEGG